MSQGCLQRDRPAPPEVTVIYYPEDVATRGIQMALLPNEATSPPAGTIPIVFAADDNHAVLLAVAHHTAVANLGPGASLRVFVIDGGFKRRSKEKLERVVARAHPV